jgi:hypothetical protein
MQQKSGDHWWPGFFSRKLTDTESRYSTFDRELLAAHAAVRHFRHFYQGSAFQLWTNHKLLVTIFVSHFCPISPRQQCHLAFISEFIVLMLFCPVRKMLLPIFSRPPPPPPEPFGTVTIKAVVDTVDFEAMAAEQNGRAKMQRLLGVSSLKILFRQAGAQRLVGDVSTGVFRPVVPEKFRKYICLNLHNISHPGRLASWCMIFSRFVWRGLSSDVNTWARSFLHWQ